VKFDNRVCANILVIDRKSGGFVQHPGNGWVPRKNLTIGKRQGTTTVKNIPKFTGSIVSTAADTRLKRMLDMLYRDVEVNENSLLKICG
jgi:hypothetical protein